MRNRLKLKTIFFPKLNKVAVTFYGQNMISITLFKNLDLFNPPLRLKMPKFIKLYSTQKILGFARF